MKKLLLIVFECVSAFAFGIGKADAISGSFGLPTRLVDSRPLPSTGPEALKDFTLEWWTCSGAAPNFTPTAKVGEALLPASPQTFATPIVPPGLYCLRISPRNNANEIGPWSGWASKLVLNSPIDGTTIIITVNAGGTVNVNVGQ
jgi:hypothetical protein